jgi:hypothetical protein
MREGESQIDRDVAVDVDAALDSSAAGIDGSASSDRDPEGDADETGAVRSRLGAVATERSLLTALALSVVGAVALSFVPFLSVAGTVLGIAVGGFAYGLGSDARRYVEMALAGAVTGGGATVLGNLIVALVASGTTLVGFGVLAGTVAGVVGHYFGRDLRDGLTADLD